jgi:hypothetical protein
MREATTVVIQVRGWALLSAEGSSRTGKNGPEVGSCLNTASDQAGRRIDRGEGLFAVAID